MNTMIHKTSINPRRNGKKIVLLVRILSNYIVRINTIIDTLGKISAVAIHSSRSDHLKILLKKLG